MSAIGKCAILKRDLVEECAARARAVHKETIGLFFKKTVTVGKEEFREAWRRALVEEDHFDFSGYALGEYLDAQKELNGFEFAERGPFDKVFTAGFRFDQPVNLPQISNEKLKAYCDEQFGADAPTALEAFKSADKFYRRNLAKIDAGRVAVFIIS